MTEPSSYDLMGDPQKPPWRCTRGKFRFEWGRRQMKNNKLQSAWERTSGIRGGEVLIGSSAHVRSSTTVKVLLLGALSVIGTALLAHVRIPLPFTPVPLTGQTFGIMLTGLLLGARRGGLSMTAYGLIG